MQEVKRNIPGDEEATRTLKAWWLLGLCLSVSNIFLLFCICVCFLLFLFFASSSLSLYWFLHSLLPCSADFICRKMEQRLKASPCFFLVSPLFFFIFSFLFFLFYCLPSWSHNNARMKERNSLCSLRFLSLINAYLSCVSSYLSFFCLSPPLSPSWRGLHSLTCSSI